MEEEVEISPVCKAYKLFVIEVRLLSFIHSSSSENKGQTFMLVIYTSVDDLHQNFQHHGTFSIIILNISVPGIAGKVYIFTLDLVNQVIENLGL